MTEPRPAWLPAGTLRAQMQGLATLGLDMHRMRAAVGSIPDGADALVPQQAYRAGRGLMAGDASHVHSPAGGQGMNAGILDAVSLAGALEQALADKVAALDAYSAQRRPTAQDVVAFTDRLTRIATVRVGWRSVRNLVVTALSKLPIVRRQPALRLSGLVYQ